MPPPEVGELEESKLRDMDVSGQGGVAWMRGNQVGLHLGRGLRTRGCAESKAADSSSGLGTCACFSIKSLALWAGDRQDL